MRDISQRRNRERADLLAERLDGRSVEPTALDQHRAFAAHEELLTLVVGQRAGAAVDQPSVKQLLVLFIAGDHARVIERYRPGSHPEKAVSANLTAHECGHDPGAGVALL